MSKRLWKYFILALVGYNFYVGLEITFRGNSYALMGICGALSLILVGSCNNLFGWDMALLYQMIIGGGIITLIEYVFGMCDKFIWHLNMWSYKDMPFHDPNEVICLPFSLLWCLLSFVAIIIDDAISYYCFHENPRPYYKSVTGKILFKLPKRECDVANHEES